MANDEFAVTIPPQPEGKMSEMLARAMGEAVLRQALEQILECEDGSPAYVSRVYMALMGASDAGYQCGIKPQIETVREIDIIAVIVLPTGVVELYLPTFGDFYESAPPEEDEKRIREFLAPPPGPIVG